jgi:phage terminase large subunit-like protein
MTIALTSSDALDVLSGLILEDGRAWADVAEDIQWEDARAILDLDASTPYHFLTRARGRSKTTDLAGIALVVMLTQARPGDRLYALAVDKAQGGLLVNAIRGFVQRTPGLAAVVRVGQYKVTTPGDVVLEVLAADAAGTWGLCPAFLIVDEIAWWPETPTALQLWEASSTAMHKVPGSRMVVLTTAGDPTHFSYQIRARAERSRLWRLHEVPGPPPWADPARIEDERDSLTDASWQRLFMNIWTDSDDRFTNREDVMACLHHDGTLAPGARTDYTIGVDLGLVDDPTVAVVAHKEEESDPDTGAITTVVVVDHIEVWAGSHDTPVPLAEVEAWLGDTAGRYNGAEIVMDSWQGAGMAQQLRTHGIVVTDITFTAQVNDHLARTMLPLLRGHRLALPHDDDLVDELVNLRIVERSPGQYRIEHAPNRHNDRAIAIALAAQHLLNKPARRKAELIV